MTTYQGSGHKLKESRRSLSLIFITYLLIFGPKFYVADITVITAFGLAIYYLVKVGVNGRITKNVLYPWLCISTIVIYFSIVSVATNNDPSPLAMEFGKLNLYILSAAGLVELYRNHYVNKYAVPLLQDISISILGTAILVVTLFLLPDVRYYLYSLVDIYLFHGRDPTAITNRITDLSIGGSTVSLMFVFGAILSVDSRTWQLSKAFEYWSLLFYLIFVVAALLTGRTGFILILTITAVWLINRSFKSPLSVINTIGKVSVTVFAIAILAMVIKDDEAAIQFENKIAPWAFELLYSYIETGELKSESGSYLVDQYMLPDTLFGILFGGERYDMPSDSLFVKLFHSVGLIGVVMSALMIVVLLHGKKNKTIEKYLFIYLALLLVGNLKETMLGNSRGAIIIFLVLVIAATRDSCIEELRYAKNRLLSLNPLRSE